MKLDIVLVLHKRRFHGHRATLVDSGAYIRSGTNYRDVVYASGLDQKEIKTFRWKPYLLHFWG